jgi:aminoglycoside phosphotransferase (APT) family kinase protein
VCPGLLDRLDGLPQTYAHGDASPQNLLIPVGDRSTRMVIDWGLEKPVPVGFDLGQLLIGLVHADEMPVRAMPGVEAAIGPAYCAGLAAEGAVVDESTVRTDSSAASSVGPRSPRYRSPDRASSP